MGVPIGDAVARDEAPDLGNRGDAGGGESAKIVASMMDVRLEIPGATPEPRRDLWQDAPGEMLERLVLRIPRRQNGRAEELRMAVFVPMEGTNVVGRLHVDCG